MTIKQFLWGDQEPVDLWVDDDVTCSGCVRYHERMNFGVKDTYCQMLGKGHVEPTDKCCRQYWDRELLEKSREEYERKEEEERLARIEGNKDKPPVEIAWAAEYDGATDSAFLAPECPVCHKYPYSTEQCYFCGTKFIQDDPALLAYKEENTGTKEETSTCPKCGGVFHTISFKRNGEWRFSNGWCEGCKTRFFID